jgi:hypothetical protein
MFGGWSVVIDDRVGSRGVRDRSVRTEFVSNHETMSMSCWYMGKSQQYPTILNNTEI